MDKREIASKGQALQKAVAGKEPTSNLLAILNDLKANVRPTEQLLRETNIGRIVNKVKGVQGLDPQVAQLASEIIGRWRNVVNAAKNTSGTSTPTNVAKTNGTAPTSKPATPTPKASSPTGVDPAKRTKVTDKVNLELYPNDKSRNNCVGLLYDGLVQNTTYEAQVVLDKAIAIEIAVLTKVASSDSSSASYKEKIRSLYQNFKNKANPELRHNVIKGEGKFKVDSLVKLDATQLKSQEQKEEDSKLEKQNLADAMVAQEEESISTSLECGKCHEKKVSYRQAQTRSADEPMTTFCKCLNCGNRWKFS
ncbi:Transcription elongation factor S-II [Cyphellophora attinorum]|uniref:Transcription elongation factor S-II n=1 Tax=Cyphellophora attinorum TaxID=1664694 RepID=A0A0N1GYD2_9EURO|nr:Transcription elongation factor S-II [Phialophora attinorum]KPI35626.1 Transcription elongation factor S-II [Phialophora attinorum]